MKPTLRPALFAALAFGASTASLLAQTPGPSPHNPPDGPPPHHGPPPSPLFEALDANRDGVLSADEIANAPAALTKLAGTAGQITRDSLRPPPRDRTDGSTNDQNDARPHPSRSDREAGANPPPDRRHGPPPDHDNRAQNRRQPAAADPASSPSASPSPGPDGQGPPRHHGPPHGAPLFDALDANHDGTISAAEITNAAAALKALDEDGDGQLSRQELRPPPPPGPSN